MLKNSKAPEVGTQGVCVSYAQSRQLRSPPTPGGLHLLTGLEVISGMGGREGALTEHQSLLGLACH